MNKTLQYFDFNIPARPVKFRRQDIVQHAPSVTNLKAARFDATYLNKKQNKTKPQKGYLNFPNFSPSLLIFFFKKKKNKKERETKL